MIYQLVKLILLCAKQTWILIFYWVHSNTPREMTVMVSRTFRASPMILLKCETWYRILTTFILHKFANSKCRASSKCEVALQMHRLQSLETRQQAVGVTCDEPMRTREEVHSRERMFFWTISRLESRTNEVRKHKNRIVNLPHPILIVACESFRSSSSWMIIRAGRENFLISNRIIFSFFHGHQTLKWKAGKKKSNRKTHLKLFCAEIYMFRERGRGEGRKRGGKKFSWHARWLIQPVVDQSSSAVFCENVNRKGRKSVRDFSVCH